MLLLSSTKLGLAVLKLSTVSPMTIGILNVTSDAPGL